jgi:RsiW-degrading membrane proteinase PrsW (M82 family)
LVELSGFYLSGLGFVVGGALFWVLYFDLKDYLNPEPRRMLLLGFFLGCVAAVVAWWLFRLTDLLGLPQAPGNTIAQILVVCVVIGGPIEEGTKFLAARLFLFRSRHFDEPIDGLVYASAVAIGFASVENLLYLNGLTWIEALARAAASPLTHSLFASIWGFGAARAFFRARTRGARFLWQAGTLALSMVVHGLYNFSLFAYNAGYIAAFIALILWLSLIAYARSLVRASGGRKV